MNTYRTEFFKDCPANGIRIGYRLEIKTTSAIVRVEDILAAVDALPAAAYHEQIADALTKLGGLQKLVAFHHGVTIETVRGAP